MSIAGLSTDCFLEQLMRAGLSPQAAAGKSIMYEKLADHLTQCSDGSGPVAFWHVPGRIEIFGKHTDYCGGRSLLCALERGFCVAAQPRKDARVRLEDIAGGCKAAFDIACNLPPQIGRWSNYALTVIRRMARDFTVCRSGMNMAFCSDLPQAAGLSSSSALVTATSLAFAFANRLEEDPAYRQISCDGLALAGYLGAAESGRAFKGFAADAGVGTLGGSQDHAAIVCSQADCCIDVEFLTPAITDTVAISRDVCFVIGVSGVVAEKTGAAGPLYNHAVGRAQMALTLLNRQLSPPAKTLEQAWRRLNCNLGTAMAVLRQEAADVATADNLGDRVRQYVIESHELIPAAAEALKCGRIHAWRDLARQSHELAGHCLGNQMPQTDFLAIRATQIGAVASSPFGAGFGGSVWAMVPRDAVEEFSIAWRKSYDAAFPAAAQQALFFASRPGPPAFRLAKDTANAR